jgi:hypothetical protein
MRPISLGSTWLIMGNGSRIFPDGKSFARAICPTLKAGQIFLFYFQDLEFHLAAGRICLHYVANLVIHDGAANGRFV